MLCDSQIYNNRRRITLSSIVKVNSSSLIYMHSSPRLFIGIDEELNDFVSFDWINEITTDRTLKTKNNEEIHLAVSFSSIYSLSYDIYLDIQRIGRSLF